MTEEGTGTERARMRPARCRMRAVAEAGLTTATNGVTGDVVAQVQKQRAVAGVAVAAGAKGRGVKHPYRCRSPSVADSLDAHAPGRTTTCTGKAVGGNSSAALSRG